MNAILEAFEKIYPFEGCESREEKDDWYETLGAFTLGWNAREQWILGEKMTPNEYQTLAARTLIDGPDFVLREEESSAIIHAVDMASAVGELTDYLKKGIFHRHGLDYFVFNEDLRKVLISVSDFFSPIKFSLNDAEVMFLWNTVGLIGEVGEIAKLAYEALLHGHFDRNKLKKELGDCLWYLAALCTKADFALEDVMVENIEKLKVRYPNGFSAEDSRKRVDVES